MGTILQCRFDRWYSGGMVPSLIRSTVLCFMFLLSVFQLSGQDIAKAMDLERSGKRADAVLQYETWLKENPNATNYFEVLLHTVDINENYDEAIRTLKEGLSRAQTEDRKACLLKLATLSEMLGRIDEAAISYYNAFFSVTPTEDYQILLKSANLYMELGDYPKARSIGKMVLTVSQAAKFRAEAAVLLSRIYLVEGNLTEAKELVLPLVDQKEIEPASLLWIYALGYYTGDKELLTYARKRMETQYPNSMEYALMTQSVEYYPSPVNYLGLLPPIALEVEEKGPSSSEGSSSTLIMIQTGSFLDRENAEYMVKDLKSSGFNPEIKTSLISGKTYYKVVIPSIPEKELQKHLVLLKEKGFEGYPLYER